MSRRNIELLHRNHIDWRKELDFYYEQIIRFEGLLNEVSCKNTINKVKPQIAQFQNKFLLQKDMIDRLEDEIKMQESELSRVMSSKTSHMHFKDQETMCDRMNSFFKNYSELKKSFVHFSEEWI
jgi:DNA-directed RNA polymerase specialized sigma54-like protein